MKRIKSFFKFLLILLIILGLLGSGIFYYCYKILPDVIKHKLEKTVSTALSSDFSIGSLELKYLDNEVIVQNVSLREPSSNSQFIDIPNITIDFNFLNLIGDVVEIDKVVIYSPQIRLRTSAAELVNLTILKKFIQKHIEQETFKGDIDQQPEAKKEKSVGKKYIIRKLEVYGMDISRFKADNSLVSEVKIEKIVIADMGLDEHGLSSSQLIKALLDLILYKEKPAIDKKQLQSLGNDIRVLKDRVKGQVKNKVGKLLNKNTNNLPDNNFPNQKRVPVEN